MIEQEAFQDLSSLEELNLSFNLITMIEEEAFQDLSSLEELNLSFNPIRESDTVVDKLLDILPRKEHFKVLRLSAIKLTNPPSCCLTFPTLKYSICLPI